MACIAARFKLEYPGFCLDVDLNLPVGGVSVLFGHSGSGKTSLLRCIAGLERPENGRLSVGGDTWQDATQFVPPHRRPIGYVFQEASLFGHLTARENLRFATKRAPKTDNPIAFDTAVQLLGIETLLDRNSHQLSGGEKQRVAIARALLVQPRLLLMDEPLASLDLPRKLEILPYLEDLKRQLNLPVIYVSHAADEVARLADYLVVLERGRAQVSGNLGDTLSQLDFPLQLGEDAGVVLQGVVRERDDNWSLVRVAFAGGEVWLRDGGQPLHSQVRVRILARDVSLARSRHTDTSILNSLAARIAEIAPDEHDGLVMVRLEIADNYLVARVTRRSVESLGLRPGVDIWAQIKSAAVL